MTMNGILLLPLFLNAATFSLFIKTKITRVIDSLSGRIMIAEKKMIVHLKMFIQVLKFRSQNPRLSIRKMVFIGQGQGVKSDH